MTGLLLALAVAAAPARAGVDAAAVDRSADPCADFFKFACGGWIQTHPIPSDQTRWGRFQELAERNRTILRGILEEAAEGKDAARRKIGDAYAACMDEAAADGKGAAPIRDLLAGIDDLRGASGLAALVGKLEAQGAGGPLSFGSLQDYEDASVMIAYADQGGWSLPDRDYYLKPAFSSDRSGFRNHVVRMFKLLGDSRKEAAREAAAVLAVETALAKAAMARVDRREPENVHHKTGLSALKKATPRFAWDDYLAAAGVPSFSKLDVVDPGFFEGLDALVASVPLPSWRSYLRWRVLHAFAPHLSSAFVREDFAFFGRRLRGQRELKPRWKRCVALVDRGLGEALGKAYVEKAFPAGAKAETRTQIAGIEKAMRGLLSGLEWLTPATRAKALAKLDAVANKVGYPDRWRDYSELSISRDDLVGNVRRAEAFEFRRQLRKIGRPADRAEWEITPPTVNAYYDPQKNDINFPAGILQPPFFEAGGDAAFNYGAIGAVEGHELTHGFDDEGRHYDARGDLSDWWAPEDAEAFERRARGLVEQYSRYTAFEGGKDGKGAIRVDGRLTLGENTADNGGVKLAHAAMLEGLGPDDRSRVGGFTREQRFFLGWAQVWCSRRTREVSKSLAVSDPHPPPEARVNGVVSNMPEFGAAFLCREGSPMSPRTRSGVW